jgi:phage baseplate assembly protein V
MSSSSPPSPLELLRRLENLLRAGTIYAVNHNGSRVRVQSGDLRTGWLPWFERRAGNVRTWCPPSVGEQCLVLSPGGDPASGMVLVGLESDENPAPSDSPTLHRTLYPDGTVIDYDHGSHALNVDAPGGSLIRLRVGPTVLSLTPEGVTLVAPDVDFQLG